MIPNELNRTVLSFIKRVGYILFLLLIGLSVYHLDSATPLWALLLFPGTITFSSKKKKFKQSLVLLRMALRSMPTTPAAGDTAIANEIRQFLQKHEKL